MRIAIINQTSVLSATQTRKIATALRAQALELAELWERVPAEVRLYASLASIPRGACIIALLDDADQAGVLGYHDVTPDGRSYARVFAKTILDAGGTVLTGPLSVSACASHEMCEAFCDPGAQLWATIDGTGGQVALEACDPVQDSSYVLKGVAVSDFVLPAYFNPFDTKGPYSRLGAVTAPAPALAKGGYAIVEHSSGERQIFGEVPGWKSLEHSRTASRAEITADQALDVTPAPPPSTPAFDWRDTIERLFWTVVAAMLGNIAGSTLIGLDAWKAAVLAGITGAVNFLLIAARARLAVLPDPGHGLGLQRRRRSAA